MAIVVDVITQFREGGVITMSDVNSLATADDGEEINVGPVSASATQQVKIGIVAANVKAYRFLADHTCDLKANSTSAPDFTIHLVAGKAKFYPGGANEITADVVEATGFYLVNTAGASVTLAGKVWQDVTP